MTAPQLLSFTRDELAASFALLMPQDIAYQLAAEWWELFSEPGSTEYSHVTTWGPVKPVEPQGHVELAEEWNTPDMVLRDESLFLHYTDDDLRGLLLRLGDTHLALLALVNEDLFERMRQVRYMTNRGAARNRLQLTRAVRAFRRARGMPPTV